ALPGAAGRGRMPRPAPAKAAGRGGRQADAAAVLDAAAAGLSPPEEALSDAPDESGLDASEAGLDGAPLLRKSVTYQPDPLSWKPAAVTCLAKVSCPHCGHVDSGASDTFWSTSWA